MLPLGFESAGRFAFLGGGGIGVGAGWHCGGEGGQCVGLSIVVLMHGGWSRFEVFGVLEYVERELIQDIGPSGWISPTRRL